MGDEEFLSYRSSFDYDNIHSGYYIHDKVDIHDKHRFSNVPEKTFITGYFDGRFSHG